MTYQAHADAVLGLLAAATGSPALKVFDGFVPPTTQAGPPYVVVYLGFDSPEAELDMGTSDFTNASLRVNCSVTCHSVGANAIAARAVAARVRGALLDVSPTVTGRTCFPMRMVDSQPLQRDESTGVTVMDQVDVYRLSSVPSS